MMGMEMYRCRKHDVRASNSEYASDEKAPVHLEIYTVSCTSVHNTLSSLQWEKAARRLSYREARAKFPSQIHSQTPAATVNLGK